MHIFTNPVTHYIAIWITYTVLITDLGWILDVNYIQSMALHLKLLATVRCKILTGKY